MLEIILDTETTGLSTTENHRIVEIGCIELNNLIPTKKIFHEYINPERPVSTEAYKIHGYSDKFLSDKKLFSQIVDDFLEFIKDKRIIIHNANFDLSFLNYELAKIKREKIEKKNIIDTLEIARQKYPGSQNSLDALCKRYNIDNSRREKHTALIDCQLLQEVYVNLIDQKEPKLNLENVVSQYKDNYKQQKNKLRKIIKISSKESELHKEYLKNNLKNNYFN
mgnify:CR=1 FL=1|tara:strand:+ start:293 stop:961 length:669 start_codon:yes stop_codon:yes gene_type:complete